MNASRAPIPLTIIGGYLGAGKTTLLNHLLSCDHGCRIAVLVNDFGTINVDAQLVSARDGETISLANGCICCSIGDSLGLKLLELQRRPRPPDRLIIEASGVSNPWNIAQIGLAGSAYRLDGILVLADAELVHEQARDRYVGETVKAQLGAADIIVLNKIDLVHRSRVADLRDWINKLVPHARLIETVRAEVPHTIVMGIPADHVIRTDGNGSSHEQAHVQTFRSWSLTVDTPFDGALLRAVIGNLPSSIIRAKGVLRVDEAPMQRTVWQLVGRRWTLTPGGPWGAMQPRSQLTLIGLRKGLDVAALRRQFLAALSLANENHKRNGGP